MKCFVYTTLLAIALSSALCSAAKNDEFRERAEIYSSNVFAIQSKRLESELVSIKVRRWCIHFSFHLFFDGSLTHIQS